MRAEVACEWPGCGADATTRVHGHEVCRVHEVDVLRKIVVAGPTGALDSKGRPKDRRWLNSFARLVDATAIAQGEGGEPSAAKIKERAYDFCLSPPCVRFSIERHPAGSVTEQRCVFNVETDKFCSEETPLRSDLPTNADGRLCCPDCESIEIVSSPGRVRCLMCGFEILHDHTR